MAVDIIAVANQKGGVGKTTTAVALAAESYDRGACTLLIDGDAQGTATAIWGLAPDEAEDSGLYTLLQGIGRGRAVQPLNEISGYGNDMRREALLPATLELAKLEMELQGVMHREHLLADVLRQLGNTFDRIIIDCPPSFGLLTINALSAARRVVIPCVPDYVSVQGLGSLWDTIQLVQARINSALTVAGVVITRMQPKTLHHRDYAADIALFCMEHDIPLLGTVPNTIKVADASGGGLAVTRYADANGAGAAYRAVADALYGGSYATA
jgi:chromosome partitioning protein